ncbi:unnamed protein product [Dovyalis caffra]|uniref:Uncharacterized protein n=1 Tax=Dovyalis caffra TaxID=77055 RepID=A0AAV1S2J0_9ROSI|nr:unnamed protein product [Dovyalis caffra]
MKNILAFARFESEGDKEGPLASIDNKACGVAFVLRIIGDRDFYLLNCKGRAVVFGVVVVSTLADCGRG